MDPLFVITASDGSSLILAEDPADPQKPFRLVFQHDVHGAPEPLRGALPAFWVTIAGQPHVVFAGDTLDEPGVDRILLGYTDREQTCRALPARHRGKIWMSFPEPFGAGAAIEPGAVVTARWLTRDGRIHATNHTPPLQWGVPVPPKLEPPPPEWPEVPSPEDDPDGWTGYSPG